MDNHDIDKEVIVAESPVESSRVVAPLADDPDVTVRAEAAVGGREVPWSRNLQRGSSSGGRKDPAHARARRVVARSWVGFAG